MEFTARDPFGAKNFDLVSKFSEDVYTPGIIFVYGKFLTVSGTWGGGDAPQYFFLRRNFFWGGY